MAERVLHASSLFQEHLQELFSDFGKVVRVFIQKSPSLPMPDEKTDPFFPSRNPCLVKTFFFLFHNFHSSLATDVVGICSS